MKKKEIIASIAIAGTIVGTAAHHQAPNYSGAKANSNNKNIKDVTLLANQTTNEIGQVTNTSFLHFRSGPSTNDSIIRTLPGNQKMTILGEYGSWYKVNINGTIGYVYSAYVNIISGTSNEIGTLVNTTFLHLRSSASIYSDILETIHSNDTITVLGQVGSWYKVEVNGQVGFVYGYYLNISNSNTANQTPSQGPSTPTTSNNKDSIGIGHLINTTFLHFRTEPTIDSNIIETLYNNSDITVLARENNGWYKIEVNGQVGYVDGYYLAIAENTPAQTKPSPAPIQKPINQTSKFIGTGTLANTTFLHFRSEANLDSNIISTLNENSIINVIKKVGSWYEVSVNGQVGYVYGYYLNVNTNINNDNSNQPSLKGIGSATLTNTTFLHFRSEPNTDCSIIETLYSNDQIIVLSNENNGWYKIEVNGQIGYADGYYLNVTLNSSSTNSTNSANNQNSNMVMGEVVNSPYLHVRAGAGTNFSILEDIYLGNKVQVLKKIGSWYEIKINGKIGYVYDYYLNIISGNLNNNTNNTNNSSSNNNNNEKSEKGLVVNLNTLNVRSEPSTGSKILGTLNGGAYVNIVSSKNGWYEIEYNGSTAYVSANYIQVVSPYDNSSSNDVENVTNFSGTGTVNAYLVNIRAGASTNSAIIGQETIGSPVTITGEKNGFYRIKLGKTYGFMTKNFITLNSSNNTNSDQGQNNNQNINENQGNSSNSGKNDSTSSQITTNYPISLNDYINLEYNNWPLFSKQQFMDAINPQLIDNMFEFLSINQYRPVSLSGMNNLLEGKGVLSGQGQAFINACKQHNIDPVYFVNQSILETGYGQSRLAKGVTISQIAIQSEPIYNSQGQLTGYQMQQLPHPVTVYNLFGIGAEDNSSAFPNRALILGTTYAYTHGWTSISNAISGAADFVSSAYIHNNYYAQNTVYKLRFSPQISSIWHQYCTNIWYAKELADLMKQNSSLYLPGDHFTYDVPVFQS